jgi:hypothetical protein
MSRFSVKVTARDGTTFGQEFGGRDQWDADVSYFFDGYRCTG